MIKKIKKLKKIRLHREGTDTLVYGFIVIAAIALLLWRFIDSKVPFWCFTAVMGTVYCIVINFFRCPIRFFPEEDTTGLVVAPADGRIVVIEEVDEDVYFHERRIMVSIFMSLFNVHANWFPVDGKVKTVAHHDGNFRAAEEVQLPQGMAPQGERGERARRRSHHHPRRHRHPLPPDSRRSGSPHRHLR